MKPGVSDASTGVFRHCCIRAYAALERLESPPSHGTISTSGSTGAGLKKWMPITRAGALAADAIDATESDEVLVASTAFGDTALSRPRNRDCLAARSST